MRLFVALLPPPWILDELAAFLAPHQACWPGLRWVRRDLLHITLAFVGEVDGRAVEELEGRLERAAARHSRLALSFAGAGAFPGGGAHARVLWTGLYGDRRPLAQLAAAATAAASKSTGRSAGGSPGRSARGSGAPVDRHRGFRPHLTLARSRHPMDLRPLLEALSTYAGPTWTADSVHLMRSHLPAKENPQLHYEPLKAWPLP